MGGMPVVPVSVAKVSQESVPTELKVVGTVEASAIVQVKSQVAGELMSVHFTEGQNVAKGDLLFEIDPQPFDDALRQAQAAVERDKAQIAQAEAGLARDKATARFAQSDAQRQAELNKGGLTPHSVYDQAQSSADAADASARASLAAIDTAKAALDSDQAAVAAAKLNLAYCRILAPISGRTGNLLVHPGNLVKVNDVPLVVIHQVSPIFVDFAARSNTCPPFAGSPRGPQAGRARAVPGRSGPRRRRLSLGDRQYGGFHHRHDSSQGDVRERRPHVVAGPVRHRYADARYHPECRGGARRSRAERPAGTFRVRRQAG